MAWGALLKGVAKGVGRGARRVATDKLLNRKKNVKNRRAKAQEAMGGGEEQGGQLMIRPSTSLVPSGPSGIIPAPATDTGGGGDTSTVEGTLMTIQTKVVKVENLLKGSNAVKEKMREDARQAAKDEEDKKQEKDLEKVKPKKEGKGKFKMPKVPGTGIFGAIWKFISTIILGRLFMIFFDHLPKLLPILGVAAKIVDGLIGFIGWIGKIAMTIIDWGYKLIGGVSDWVGETFGKDVQKGFDMFLGVIKDLIAAFLVWKIWAQKAVEAAIASLKRAFRIARIIVKRALRFAKKAIRFAKNIAAKAGKWLSKIPGVKTVVGKIGQFGGKALQAGKGLLGKAGGLLKTGATKGASKVGGFVGKIFGKAAKFIVPAFKGAKPFVSKFFGRIPIVGPLIVGIVSILSGEPAGKAIFKTIGAALGGFLGGTLAAAVTTATVGIGALVAPAMVMLGELIGVFVGDMLYELIFGGGLKKVLSHLKKMVGGVFSKILDVGKWLASGFSRFYEGIPKFKVPDFPEDPPGVMSKVPFAGRVWKGLKVALKVMIGPLSLLMGKEIPNLLWLMNPINTGPLLLKSFFPPKGEGGGDTSEKDAKKEEDKLKMDDKPKEEKKEEKKSSSIGEVIAKMFKDEGASDGKNLIATNQKSGAQGVIDSLKTKADYEEDVSEIKVNLPPPPTPQPMVGGSGKKEVVRVPVPVGVGGDPYEDLDFFG